MIEFEQVSKRYGPAPSLPWRRSRPVHALRDVDLGIPAGGVWGVVGPNGAGKTTLFALLLGFIHPTAGRISVDARPPRDFARQRGAGYLPERFQLPGEWTVRDTLRTLARLEGLNATAATARADASLERLGLEPHAAKPLAALSRGLLQRVGLAQALLGERDLIVLDEPTEGLDPLWRIRFRAIVEELRAEGRTVLMASHDLAEVERLADRAVLLEGGRVVRILDLPRGPAAGASLRYRLVLAAPAPAVAEAFPGAAPADGQGAQATPTGGAAFTVEVGDVAELSTRLAALLAAGATVVAVEPLVEALEERVRRALAGDGQAGAQGAAAGKTQSPGATGSPGPGPSAAGTTSRGGDVEADS